MFGWGPALSVDYPSEHQVACPTLGENRKEGLAFQGAQQNEAAHPQAGTVWFKSAWIGGPRWAGAGTLLQGWLGRAEKEPSPSLPHPLSVKQSPLAHVSLPNRQREAQHLWAGLWEAEATAAPGGAQSRRASLTESENKTGLTKASCAQQEGLSGPLLARRLQGHHEGVSPDPPSLCVPPPSASTSPTASSQPVASRPLSQPPRLGV